MLSIYNLIIKLHKQCKSHFIKKKFSTRKEKILKSIEINKEILKNDNIHEVINLIKENENSVNIINYATCFHRLMQIVHRKNTIYIKNKEYIDIEIEKKIKIIFEYLSHNRNIKNINNYNKRLFSSFIWSLSKYFCFLSEHNQNFNIQNDLKKYRSKFKKIKPFYNSQKNGDTFENNGDKYYIDINQNNKILKNYDRCSKKINNISNKDVYGNNCIHKEKENRPIKNEHNKINLNENYIFNSVNIDLLYHYANIYLSSLNPSRYIIVIWSLSKLNKNNKNIHEKYWKKSLSLIPLLKEKEVIILLYSYSYVNFSNFLFYLKIKNFILEKNIYKKIINEKNYESINNMLLSYANQNIFFPDLFESTITYILQKKYFLNSLKNKELLTILYCICKFPFLYVCNKNKNEVLKSNVLRKNIILYELLKKKIMKRYNLNTIRNVPIHENNCLINRKTVKIKSVNNTFTLENLILIIWSLSFKYIYSATLFLRSFILLNNIEKNENYIYNYYPILTNFYLSFLSFILEDEILINLYLNREENKSLNILNENINIFIDNFITFKNSISMNQRKNDIEISQMQKYVFYLIKNFKWSKNIVSILEYKTPLNISIDILLFKKNNSTISLNSVRKYNNNKIMDNKINTENNYISKNENNNIRKMSSSNSINTNNNNYNICSTKNNNINGISHLFFFNMKNYFSIKYHKGIKKNNNISNIKLYMLDFTIHSMKKKFLCSNNKNNENIIILLYEFIEKIKLLNWRSVPNGLAEINKNLLFFFSMNFKYINKYDIIGFFYKYSSFFTYFYKLKGYINVNELFKTFAFFHDFAFAFLKTRNQNLNLFIDISWIYFRYIKYLRFLSKEINSNNELLEELKVSKDLLFEEINILLKIFDIIKKIIIEENIINKISSKDMTFLISIFLYLENSHDIINHLEKYYFNNIRFTIKDIIFILNAIYKCEITYNIEYFFCKKFIENIEDCETYDLVQFTYLCAELKINNKYISEGIVHKINSKVNKKENIEKNDTKQNMESNYSNKMVVDKSSNHCSFKFIETFQHEQLALFIRNCYRMHCFDKVLFDLLCNTALKKYKEFNTKSLCIILPCFARIYCLHKPEDNCYQERESKKEKKKKKKIIIEKNKKGNNDYLQKYINNCKYNIPVSLKKLIEYSEKKIILDENLNFYNLCYYMETITLLKIENKKLYNFSIEKTLEKIQAFPLNQNEIKLLGKMLWCLSYYHKTEFLFSVEIINFILKNKIYQNIIPENFTSIFLYFIKSRVYNKELFHNIGKIILLNISLNDYFSHKKKKKKNQKLNVITELYATMAWAYAFTFHDNINIKEKRKEEDEKDEKKNINNNIIENDTKFLINIYNYIFNEIKILQKYHSVSFLLLARFLWGISVVNLVNQKIFNFLNLYKWNNINISEQNHMHLHMVFILWLRIKYGYSKFDISENFLQLKDQIIQLFKKNKISKTNNNKNRSISNFHYQISRILDRFNIKHENEYITEDFLSIDIIIKNIKFQEKIAIEVDGPSHHLLLLDNINETEPQNIKKEYVKCGTTYFKNWLLKKSGWIVINIPSYKWNKLNYQEKNNYLIQKLSISSEYLKNHFDNFKDNF